MGIVALAAGAQVVEAADKPCTKADSDAGSKAIDRVVTWAQLQKAWQDYRHCDTDAVADLFTDAILRLVVEWKSVETLAGAMKGDAQYRDFIHAHLRSPAAKDDQETVYARAKRSCPQGLADFCSAMAEAVTPPAEPSKTPTKEPPKGTPDKSPAETKDAPKLSKPGG